MDYKSFCELNPMQKRRVLVFGAKRQGTSLRYILKDIIKISPQYFYRCIKCTNNKYVEKVFGYIQKLEERKRTN